MAGKTSSGGNRESDYGVMVDANGTVTVSEAAKLLGYSRTAVDKWIARGCPVAKPAGKGRGNVMRLHLDAVCEWLCTERSADAAMLGDDGVTYNYDTARARDMHYRAIKREAEAYEHIGALIPVDVIADVVDREYAEVRAALLSIPARLAVPLSACEDPEEASAILQAQIDRILAQLSAPEKIIRESGGDPDRSIHDDISIADDPTDDDEELANVDS